MADGESSMRRRLKFTTLTLITQMLLIALAITWLIHMITIAVNGSVYFVENNPYILWGEIAVSVLITIFAIYILSIQIQRLGERRSTDRDRDRRH
jgi:membrane protein YdbS with pleckstrin-like domain